MNSVCLYFQVHQPYRLAHFPIQNIRKSDVYFDDAKNRAIMEKVAAKCYLPANERILRLIERSKGSFRVAYSLSGVAIEQMERYVPGVLASFMELGATGCVEFLAETYYHSLSAVYEPDEFRAQVAEHSDLIEAFFGQRPKIFRNTELIYNDAIGHLVADLGYEGMIAEGVDDILGWRSPNFVYRLPGRDLKLLLKNYRLSDDVAFRFSNREWSEYPLTADKFASWIHRVSGSGDVVNLFMDYETFGEHQWADTGIFEFLDHLPTYVLAHPDWRFALPSEVVTAHPTVAELPFSRLTSWADMERDLTAWNGNRMQAKALDTIYSMGRKLRDAGLDRELKTWRKLQTSDHFYYMCTKWFSDGDVHAYFSPYESPYNAYINYQNVLRDFQWRLEAITEAVVRTQRVQRAEDTTALPWRVEEVEAPTTPALELDGGRNASREPSLSDRPRPVT